MYTYKATVINVVDGDTLDLRIDIGFKINIETRIRIARINAYETRLGSKTDQAQKELGIEAKQYVKNLIEGKEVLITTEKTGKYGRYIAEITYEANTDNEVNLGTELVRLGYAVYQDY